MEKLGRREIVDSKDGLNIGFDETIKGKLQGEKRRYHLTTQESKRLNFQLHL